MPSVDHETRRKSLVANCGQLQPAPLCSNLINHSHWQPDKNTWNDKMMEWNGINQTALPSLSFKVKIGANGEWCLANLIASASAPRRIWRGINAKLKLFSRHNINNINNASPTPTYPSTAAIHILAFDLTTCHHPSLQALRDWTIKGFDDKRIGRDNAAIYKELADLWFVCSGVRKNGFNPVSGARDERRKPPYPLSRQAEAGSLGRRASGRGRQVIWEKESRWR